MLGSQGAGALAAAGWEIGFHTRRHDLLTALDDDALRQALERGRQEATGERPLTLAYPHGKATAREARAAREAGYLAAYTGRAEVFNDRTDIHLIGRLQPDTATLGRFALQLARALSDS
jgi:peptidoglycan/xylan/chitin deacetylase (PgdA/CDA1 family)